MKNKELLNARIRQKMALANHYYASAASCECDAVVEGLKGNQIDAEKLRMLAMDQKINQRSALAFAKELQNELDAPDLIDPAKVMIYVSVASAPGGCGSVRLSELLDGRHFGAAYSNCDISATVQP